MSRISSALSPGVFTVYSAPIALCGVIPAKAMRLNDDAARSAVRRRDGFGLESHGVVVRMPHMVVLMLHMSAPPP